MGRFLPHELLGATVQGNGTETLIFLNGFGTEQSVWRHQVDWFRPHYRTLTFDHVGSGLSIIDAYSASAYASLYDYADDVLALIDEVAPGPFRWSATLSAAPLARLSPSPSRIAAGT